MKICSQCKRRLSEMCFGIQRRRGKVEILSSCKECREQTRDQWRKLNRERVRAARRVWYHRNIFKMRAACKEWRKNNRELLLARRRFRNRERYSQNPEMFLSRNRVAKYKNIEKYRAMTRKWHRKKYLEDNEFRLKESLRSRVAQAIRKDYGEKAYRTLELVGCSIPALKNHIAKQFLPGMAWENYGVRGWHIDHKLPCASFDLTDPAQQKKCFHHTNLQPLWAKDNLSKGAKFENARV